MKDASIITAPVQSAIKSHRCATERVGGFSEQDEVEPPLKRTLSQSPWQFGNIHNTFTEAGKLLQEPGQSLLALVAFKMYLHSCFAIHQC